MSAAIHSTQTVSNTAESWLAQLAARKRKPVRASSLSTFRSYAENWICPVLGEREVGSINNRELRDFVSHLSSEGLSPKSVREISSALKQIIASCVNPETGDRLYQRDWNNSWIDCPQVGAQRQPIVSAEQIQNAIAASPDMYKILYAVLGGSG